MMCVQIIFYCLTLHSNDKYTQHWIKVQTFATIYIYTILLLFIDYWFGNKITFVSWCLLDATFLCATISLYLLSYVFNFKLRYFCDVSLRREDKWLPSCPMWDSRKWSSISLKALCPSCSNTADSILRSIYTEHKTPYDCLSLTCP